MQKQVNVQIIGRNIRHTQPILNKQVFCVPRPFSPRALLMALLGLHAKSGYRKDRLYRPF